MQGTGMIAAIGEALAELQAAYDDRDRALAAYLGVGRTDLRCLDLIVRHGPQTASALGARLHLTRGSMTVLIDRLVRAGYVERHDDPHHAKRKRIVPTPLLAARIAPVATAQREGADALREASPSDLAIIEQFLRATLARQATITARYQALAATDAALPEDAIDEAALPRP